MFSPEVDSLVDMSGLVYPMIPLPLTTTSIILMTTAPNNSSTVDDKSTPEPEMNTTLSSARRTTDPTTLREPDTTSSAGPRDLKLLRSRETSEEVVAMVVVVGVSGACLLAVLLLILALLVVRHQRRSGKYDPSRPHQRWWTRCCLISGGDRSAEDPEFDTSTARLKLNTSSAFSATATPEQSSVPDRPLTNGVTTHSDPVQRTLIGPPLTNYVQSR